MATDQLVIRAGLVPALMFMMIGACFAGPVADEDRTAMDLRRTTLIVADIEQSLAFYRDALGMKITYDNMIYTPRDAGSIEAAERATRLVFLRANDDYIGVLGLMHYYKPDRGRIDIRDKTFHEGTAILVTNHEDARASYQRAISVPGSKSLWEPQETTYPSYDGEGSIRVLVSGVQDPDGFIVEINQLLDAAQTTEDEVSED